MRVSIYIKIDLIGEKLNEICLKSDFQVRVFYESLNKHSNLNESNLNVQKTS